MAIELAAARTGVLTPPAILERLTGRLRLLTAGTRDAHPRQRSLRTCLEWSVDLLSDEERRLFTVMAVFVGGATIESVEAVCAEVVPEVDMLSAVDALVAKSLLKAAPHPAGTRFSMLETIREYASELLEESGDRMTAQAAHARVLRDLLSSRRTGAMWPPRNVEELALWSAELPNARAALGFVTETDDVETAADLMLALACLWRLRGEWSDLDGRASALVDDSRLTTERRLEVFFWASEALLPQGHLERAQKLVERGLELAERSNSRFDQQVSFLQLTLSRIAFERGDLERSHGSWKDALASARRTGEPELVAFVTAYQFFTPLDRDGLADWDLALGSAHDSGNLFLEAALLCNLSELSIASDDRFVTERGVAAGLAARDAARMLGDLDGEAGDLGNAGAALLVLGSPDAAAEHLRAALLLATQAADFGIQVELLVRLAAAESALGNQPLARQLFDSWYALGDGWPHGASPSNQRLIDTFLTEMWTQRSFKAHVDKSTRLSDAVDLALGRRSLDPEEDRA